jgi:predicted RNase H-like HicB family nuclease
MLRCTVVLIYDSEGPGYVVEVPELPGCFSQGDSVEEALELIKDAIVGHVASLRAAGEDVPEETVPVIVTSVEVEDECDVPEKATSVQQR